MPHSLLLISCLHTCMHHVAHACLLLHQPSAVLVCDLQSCWNPCHALSSAMANHVLQACARLEWHGMHHLLVCLYCTLPSVQSPLIILLRGRLGDCIPCAASSKEKPPQAGWLPGRRRQMHQAVHVL